MIVVVCGMHRSGSTLVWQVARELLSGDRRLRNPRGIRPRALRRAALSRSDLLMAKFHYRDSTRRWLFPQVGARYLYSYRDPRDVVASMYRKARIPVGDERRGVARTLAIARTELRGDAFWRTRRNLWVGRYEDFHADVPGLIRGLADFLDVEVTEADETRILAAVSVDAQRQRVLDLPAQGYDADLRITFNHITDGRWGAFRQTLTPEECDQIERSFAHWLVRYDYPIAPFPAAR